MKLLTKIRRLVADAFGLGFDRRFRVVCFKGGCWTLWSDGFLSERDARLNAEIERKQQPQHKWAAETELVFYRRKP